MNAKIKSLIEQGKAALDAERAEEEAQKRALEQERRATVQSAFETLVAQHGLAELEPRLEEINGDWYVVFLDDPAVGAKIDLGRQPRLEWRIILYRYDADDGEIYRITRAIEDADNDLAKTLAIAAEMEPSLRIAVARKQQDKDEAEKRAEELAQRHLRAAHVATVTALRIRQARQRAGLDGLLGPAEDEFGVIVSDIEAAQARVSAALASLVEAVADGGEISKLQ